MCSDLYQLMYTTFSPKTFTPRRKTLFNRVALVLSMEIAAPPVRMDCIPHLIDMEIGTSCPNYQYGCALEHALMMARTCPEYIRRVHTERLHDTATRMQTVIWEMRDTMVDDREIMEILGIDENEFQTILFF